MERLLETVADIAFIAGEKGFYTGNSRHDIQLIISWAKEFEEKYKDAEWGVDTEEDYIDAVKKFTYLKIDKTEKDYDCNI